MRLSFTHHYGQAIEASSAEGRPLRAAVFNEHQVRAAAGLTLMLGVVAFFYAWFAQVYTPLRVVTAIFFVEFALRVMIGVHRSPLGLVAGWLVRRTPPQWVSARPKRFAWTLGLVMSAAMVVIVNAGVRGGLVRPLPRLSLIDGSNGGSRVGQESL